MSLHELQELLFLSHDHGAIDDEELILLYEDFLPKNPDFWYENFDRLDLNNMNDSECLAEFRVKKRDLPILSEALQLHMKCCKRYGRPLYPSKETGLPL